MKRKRILAMILAVASCLSLAVSASAASTVNRKATDFRDFDKSAWYAPRPWITVCFMARAQPSLTRMEI